MRGLTVPGISRPLVISLISSIKPALDTTSMFVAGSEELVFPPTIRRRCPRSTHPDSESEPEVIWCKISRGTRRSSCARPHRRARPW